MFAADLAMDMDLPLPQIQSWGKGGNEEKKAEVKGFEGEEFGDECVISVSPPSVSENAWDLLNAIEGNPEFNTHGIVSTSKALSLPKNEESHSYYVIPIISHNELLGKGPVLDTWSQKHEDPPMDVPVFKDEITEGEVPSWQSPLPDPVHLFEVANDSRPIAGVDTPTFFSNVDLPADVTTPDVDLSFLSSHTLELLPTPALGEALKSMEYSGLKEIDKNLEVGTTSNEEEGIPEIVAEPTTPPTVAGILRLKTGSEVSYTTGKGAALQLRRKGVKRPLEMPKVEIKQESEDQASDNSTTTIVITLTTSNSSPTTANVSCVTKDPVKDETPLKKARLGEKYIDMRRKNNEASRRSRQSRKEREQEMAMLAEKLTRENAELQQKVTALEKLRDSVKAELMKVLSGGK